MATQSISLNAADPTVKVRRIGGSLQVEAWDKLAIEASGDPAEVERENEVITVSASGDVILKVPQGASLQVDFVGRVAEIRGLSGPVDISFVGGDLKLKDLTGQVTLRGLIGGSTRMENVSTVATAGHGAGPFGGAFPGGWGRAARASERAEEHRRKFERKMQHAERKLNQMRMGFTGGRWKWGSFMGMDQAAKPDDAASDEERMAILRMLQDKKITAEEAERLLNALEGQV